MKRNIITLFIFLLIFVSQNSNAQWQQTSNGIGNDKTIKALSSIGSNIFAGTPNGVFLSTNNGMNWSAVNNGLTNLNVYALAVSGTKIFAGTYGSGGVYISTNNGTNWTVANNGLSNPNVYSLGVSGSNLFAGTYFGGVFRSTNNGTNWTQTSLTSQIVNAFAANGNNVFAGTFGATGEGGVYVTTNNGTNWTQVNNGLSNPGTNTLIFSGNNLFAATYGGLYITTNNGLNWTSVNSALPVDVVHSLAVSGTNIFAGLSGNGVYLSTNNGTNWYSKNFGFNGTPLQNSLLTFNNYIFAGTQGQSVWRLDLINPAPVTPTLISPLNNSTENPVNLYLKWNKSQNAILYNVVMATDPSFYNIIVDTSVTDTSKALNNLNTVTNYYWKVRSMNISTWGQFSSVFTFKTGSPWVTMYNGIGAQNVYSFARNNTYLFAGVPGGVFRSSNYGLNWTSVSSGLGNSNVSSLVTIGTNLFAGTEGGGVFNSTNNGDYWIAVSSGLTSQNVHALIANGTVLFAGTTSGIFRSTNNGGSWLLSNSGISNPDVRCLFLNGTNMYAGTYGGGAFVSSNNGGYWSTINNGLTNLTVNSFTATGSNLFVGTNAGVFRSTNNGTSWGSGWLTNQSILALSISDNKLFAGTSNGIFLSFNNGESWITLNEGFISNPIVRSFLLVNNYIFAATSQSVWRRELTYIIGIKQISDLVPSLYSLSQNYPNPFNPNTVISFQLPKSDNVTLKIYDLLGREIATLVNEQLNAGTYMVDWDGSNFSSGIYFYVLKTENYTDSKKMILIK